MKTLVICYSYTGTTRTIAESIAQEQKADFVEVKDTDLRSKFNAYVFGSLEARKMKQINLQPIQANFNDYDKIIIAMPIWAGYPAPAINNIISVLPSGKQVALRYCSASGGYSKDGVAKIKAAIEAKGCTVCSE